MSLRLRSILADPQYWNKYAYALNNPHKYTDSNGKHPVVAVVVGAAVGAAVGTAAGIAVEKIRQAYTGEKDDDGSKVKAAAIEGAIFGAFTGAAGPVGAYVAGVTNVSATLLISGRQLAVMLGTDVAYGAIGGAAAGEAKRTYLDQPTTTGNVITDGIAGGMFAPAGRALNMGAPLSPATLGESRAGPILRSVATENGVIRTDIYGRASQNLSIFGLPGQLPSVTQPFLSSVLNGVFVESTNEQSGGYGYVESYTVKDPCKTNSNHPDCK